MTTRATDIDSMDPSDVAKMFANSIAVSVLERTNEPDGKGPGGIIGHAYSLGSYAWELADALEPAIAEMIGNPRDRESDLAWIIATAVIRRDERIAELEQEREPMWTEVLNARYAVETITAAKVAIQNSLWKELEAARARVEELEARISVLEDELERKGR
jgi:hypothetical protein